MIIRAALDTAADRELVDRNVAHAAHTRLPRAPRTSARAWTAAELARFLDSARGLRLYPALHLTAYTGMRRGEVAMESRLVVSTPCGSSPAGGASSPATGCPTARMTGCSSTPTAGSSTPDSLSQLFDRIQCRTPRVPRIRFHDLRHTHASLLILAGVPIKVVSERVGHSHPAFTMHTYQHLLPGMSAAAAEQFAAMIADETR